jgi:hypothetical protein
MVTINSCAKETGKWRKDSELHYHSIWDDMKESTFFIGDWSNCEGTKV